MLRAFANDGTELGYVHAVFSPSVQTSATPGAGAALTMLLLKQQPDGDPSSAPVLVYRSVLSGRGLTCTFLYETGDCTGTAIAQAPPSGAACLGPDGRAWVAPAGVTGQAVNVGSRLFAVWDLATQTVAEWSCSPAAGTIGNVFAGVDRGRPPEIVQRILFAP